MNWMHWIIEYFCKFNHVQLTESNSIFCPSYKLSSLSVEKVHQILHGFRVRVTQTGNRQGKVSTPTEITYTQI